MEVIFITLHLKKEFIRPTGGMKRLWMLMNYCKDHPRIQSYFIGYNELRLPCDKKIGFPEPTWFKVRIPAIRLIEFYLKNRIDKNIEAIKQKNVITFNIPYLILTYALGFRNVILINRENFVDYRSTPNNILKRFFLLKIERFALDYSRLVIVQSFNEKNRIIERQKISFQDKIKVVPNNIPKPTHSNSLIDIENLIESKKKVVFVGNTNDPRKGFNLLLKGFEQLDRSFELYVIGKEPKNMKINQYDKRIKFLGYKENIIDILHNFDLLVVPSIEDSNPNVVLEGISSGIAVIGSNCDGISEMLGDEFTFPRNPDAIAHKINISFEYNNLKNNTDKLIKIKDRLSFKWEKKIFDEIEKCNILL